MANVSRTIDIIFNGKDNISKSVGNITNSIRKVSGVIEDIADPVARAVDKLVQMELAILAVGAAIGTIALVAFKNYEYALIDLEKVLGEGEVLAGDNQQAIEDLAIQYGKSATDIVKSTTDFKRAGFSLKDSIILLNRALELSSSGMVELSDATDDIIGIMKGFELGVDDVTHVVDAVNKVSDTFATNATELSLALRRVAPAAKLAGLSIAEVTGYVVPAIEVFRSGEEASTAWRRGLTKILDDAAPTIAALDRLGVAQREGPNKELRSGKDILLDFGKALESATSSNQLFAISQIFGNRQAVKMITAFRDMGYVMEIETVAAGATHEYTMEQVEKRWKSLETQLGASKTAITLVAAELGNNLKPAAAEVLGAVTELFSAFRDNLREGAFDTLFTILEDFGDTLASYLTEVGLKLPKALQDVDYSSLLKAFKGLFDEVAEIIDGFNLDDPEGLRKFLQEIVDTSASVIEVTTGMIEKLDEFGTKVLGLIRNFTALGAEEKRSMGRVAAGLKIIDVLGVKGSIILNEMERSAINVADAMTRVSGGIEATAGAARLLATILIEPFTLLSTIIGTTAKLLQYDLAGAWEELASHGDRVIDGLITGTKGMYNGLNKVDQGTNTLAKSLDSLEQEIQDMDYVFIDGVDDMMDKTKEFTMFLIDEFGNAIPGPISTAMDAVNDTIEEGFKEDREMIKREMIAMMDGLGEVVDKSKDKLNPFIVDEEKKKKWDEYKNGLVETIQTANSAIEGETTKFLGKFTNEALEVFKGIVPGLDEYDRLMSEAAEKELKIELDVSDDKKFKAAQAKILKEIDANADVMEAKLKTFAGLAESESNTISASFESISDSMNSTGDVLTELYRQMSDAGPNIFAQQAIQRKVTEEETRREEAFDLQKQLTTAQIDLIKQRSAAMAAGDPIITVSGDGLQPHLEAIMWDLLAAIKVQVNEDYGNFLLGIGAA